MKIHIFVFIFALLVAMIGADSSSEEKHIRGRRHYKNYPDQLYPNYPSYPSYPAEYPYPYPYPYPYAQ